MCNIFFSEELLQQGGTKYLKVPVPFGKNLSESNMRDACIAAKLKPLCWMKDSNHKYSSLECSVGNLPSAEKHRNNNRRLADLLCANSELPCHCPILDGVYFYATNRIGQLGGYAGSAGVMINAHSGYQTWTAWGSAHSSGDGGVPLYSACVKESGRSIFCMILICYLR